MAYISMEALSGKNKFYRTDEWEKKKKVKTLLLFAPAKKEQKWTRLFPGKVDSFLKSEMRNSFYSRFI